ncbi:tripartite tricarboxylate transporter substrate binding protein [Roseomonas sp. NAR14]|uniref:Tripartite tricarboxylate transporter substrate binding protein n=1 Tax=Roseomonas acroporae TaxID=2937791 RepID=A0A9X1YAV6_9PROT|nr:tripartite tricarboxylate transporter substrate binding protein [Roseomonas acroporae]MCK8786337.1 tripartite tricarboxylate transporter substrate binding protein [Roseomonas acroporae]
MQRRNLLRAALGGAGIPLGTSLGASLGTSLGTALLSGAASRAALAQPAQPGWKPNRTVTMVVPFAAGGTTDVMARLVAGPMSRALGQTVVVENTTGAGGTIGATRVARAAPDGHTLLFAHVGVLAVNPHLYNHLQYDPRDFRAVGLVGTNPMVLLVSEKSGITSIAQFRERVRQGGLIAGTSGTGTTLHLGALQAFAAAGGRGELVPYRGEAPALNDLVAGTVDLIVSQGMNAIPPALAGQAKALAVTGPARLPELPDVPTAAEAGLPGLDLEVWNAIVAPRGTPEAVAAAHDAALATAFDDPQVKARFAQFSTRAPVGEERTPAHLSALIRHEVERWGELLRAAGVGKEG